MPEKIPVPDNLYDDTGRVKDIDAAREIAEIEQRHRISDGGRLFKPGKKKIAERESYLESAGRRILGEKQREAEDRRAWELREQTETAQREEFINRNLQQSGLSKDAWVALSAEEQFRLRRGWTRAERQSPEWKLEQRLKSLVGRKVTSFDVGDYGDVKIRFEDGLVLSFNSWDVRADAPDYDGVEVTQEREENPPGQFPLVSPRVM